MASMPPAPRSAAEFQQEMNALRNRYNQVLEAHHRNRTPNGSREVQEWGDIVEEFGRLYRDRF